ncbi:alpha-1,2 mannosyltransferase KTR1 [Paracoccidioides lutzii Pb01]|uniref:Alpha-1,2 mannosyltransferase KTR1 n=1 Tax=Paracoccidioides lutzii (strain ATCC MYA-826 / Pb01) TaxID=502779 RepID=C1GVL1_PARBA|nr:alpha-1,2 mannosyltransferase KTR1 [Paracoccidioides lutzii Pb01]EEH40232.1 alpha-1,2 mannosyltransferase KTR1 [Paracoccidioides lutzii Pb01]
MNSVSGKYLRYILFVVLGLTILHFISSSSLPLPNANNVVSNLKPGAIKPDFSSLSQSLFSEKSTEILTVLLASALALAAPAQRPAYERVNATFVTLARNEDVWDISKSIRQVEDRFNRNYHYDWVFINDKPFNDEFKKVTSALVSGKTHYGHIPSEHWSFPDFIDQERAAKVREDMKEKQVIYGDSISYRHMCRYESGFFFRHELLNQFDYYWRVEPSVEYFCDINFDPFKFMKDNKKKYSFVLSLYEYKETVPTLWDSVKKFMEKYPQHIAEDNNMDFISSDGGDTYNLCHFWSNFEVGDINWLRSQEYLDYFDVLDKDGGFFYERWGDAPVHSIAAALMLKKEEVHFFNEIAYRHVPFVHCPTGEQKRLDLKCHCNPKDNFDWKGHSCTSRYFDVNKLKKPEGYEEEQD